MTYELGGIIAVLFTIGSFWARWEHRQTVLECKVDGHDKRIENLENRVQAIEHQA